MAELRHTQSKAQKHESKTPTKAHQQGATISPDKASRERAPKVSNQPKAIKTLSASFYPIQ
jgi:hypothetical protein